MPNEEWEKLTDLARTSYKILLSNDFILVFVFGYQIYLSKSSSKLDEDFVLLEIVLGVISILGHYLHSGKKWPFKKTAERGSTK